MNFKSIFNKMPKYFTQRNVAIFILLVIIVLGGLVYLIIGSFSNFLSLFVFEKTEPAPTPRIYSMEQVSSNKLPEGFPDDLPKVPILQVLQNYVARTDNEVQGTRQFIVPRSLADMGWVYDSYFRKNNRWPFDITKSEPFNATKSDTSNIIYLSGRRDNQQLMVTLTNQGLSSTLVDITVVTYKLSQ